MALLNKRHHTDANQFSEINLNGDSIINSNNDNLWSKSSTPNSSSTKTEHLTLPPFTGFVFTSSDIHSRGNSHFIDRRKSWSFSTSEHESLKRAKSFVPPLPTTADSQSSLYDDLDEDSKLDNYGLDEPFYRSDFDDICIDKIKSALDFSNDSRVCKYSGTNSSIDVKDCGPTALTKNENISSTNLVSSLSGHSRSGSDSYRKASLENLLHEIYRLNDSRRQSSVCDSDSNSEAVFLAKHASGSRSQRAHRKQLLMFKNLSELRLMANSLSALLPTFSSILIKELKKKDKFLHRHRKQSDVLTAILIALSPKRSQDTRMRFSVEPFAGDSGFSQWHDAMKMCARLPGGIPPEFRRRMWLTLAEQHVRRTNIQWKEVERISFNEWATPDDDGLGDQIVKDLHRTGCSLFCGEDAEVNQALLKRVLLGYARWNKSVGYCQGFNMLAAIILEVMDKQESDALKVMIYLIEGVLPESYFANNLRGLSVDMAVFRELMRAHLPKLSRHLEMLQHDAADQATGACYEPPLTNVFTMQWFLTLFSNCLPKEAVMRVWDLTFLQGNEMLLRTALAIWGKLSPQIMEVPTADVFYCEMGSLTREMLAHGLMDANQLVQTLVEMAPFPFPGLEALRDKYTYNITPWTQSVSYVARRGLKLFYLDEDEEEDEKTDGDDAHQTMAVATAFGLGGIFKKAGVHQVPTNYDLSGLNSLQSTRPNLDISSLKKQYTKLRERQKQAHVVLTAQNIRRRSVHEVNKQLPSLQKTNQLTMKHLLRGKKALSSRSKRVVPQGVIPSMTMVSKAKVERNSSDSVVLKRRKPLKVSYSTEVGIPKSSIPKVLNLKEPLVPKRSLPEENVIDSVKSPSETIHWKETPRRGRRASLPCEVKLMEPKNLSPTGVDNFEDFDGSSTSTELCDEDLLADLSEEESNNTLSSVRPVSTSPRLENIKEKVFPSSYTIAHPTETKLEFKPLNIFNGTNTDIKATKVLPTINLSSTYKTADEEVADEKCIVSNEPPISEIIKTLSINETPSLSEESKISLSSPTKWKWCFSEIQDPDYIKPVSPILKLHNFASEDSTKSGDLHYLIPGSETSTVKESISSKGSNLLKMSGHAILPSSNLFAYLFEITDVSKLSNVNSKEQRPVNDLEFKSNFKFLNFDENQDTISEESYMHEDETNSKVIIKTLDVGPSLASDKSLYTSGTKLSEEVKSNSSAYASSSSPTVVEKPLLDITFKEQFNTSNLENTSVTNNSAIPNSQEICIANNSYDFKDIVYNNELENFIYDKSVSYEPDLFENFLNHHPMSNIYKDCKPLNIDIDEIIKRHATSEHFSSASHLSHDVCHHHDDDKSSIVTESEYTDFDNESIMTDITEEPSVISESFTLDKKRSIFSLSENNLSLDYHSKSGLDDFISELPCQSSLKNNFKVFTKGMSLDETLLELKLPKHDLNSPFESCSSVISNKSFGSLASTSLHFTKQSTASTPEELSLGSDISLDNIDLKKLCFSGTFKSMSIDSEIQAAEEALSDCEEGKQVIFKDLFSSEKMGVSFKEDNEDSASELVKRKLWAGVKSLSLDAEFFISTNNTQKSCLEFSSSLPTLDESPGSENSKDIKRELSLKNRDDQDLTNKQKRFQKRRNSEAALQLMKENTKIIDKILNHRHGNDNIFVINNKKYELVTSEESKIYFKRRASSDHSIANSVTSLDSLVNEILPSERVDAAPTDIKLETFETANLNKSSTESITENINKESTQISLLSSDKIDTSSFSCGIDETESSVVKKLETCGYSKLSDSVLILPGSLSSNDLEAIATDTKPNKNANLNKTDAYSSSDSVPIIDDMNNQKSIEQSILTKDFDFSNSMDKNKCPKIDTDNMPCKTENSDLKSVELMHVVNSNVLGNNFKTDSFLSQYKNVSVNTKPQKICERQHPDVSSSPTVDLIPSEQEPTNSYLALNPTIKMIETESDLLNESLIEELSSSSITEENISFRDLLESKKSQTETTMPCETVSYTPFLTSKYFSSILSISKDDLKPKHSYCHNLNPDLGNVEEEITNSSPKMSLPKVPFSKLSKLSPKSPQTKYPVLATATTEKISSVKLRQSFNPFPTRPLNRPPKEAGVKLGLYTPQKNTNSK